MPVPAVLRPIAVAAAGLAAASSPLGETSFSESGQAPAGSIIHTGLDTDPNLAPNEAGLSADGRILIPGLHTSAILFVTDAQSRRRGFEVDRAFSEPLVIAAREAELNKLPVYLILSNSGALSQAEMAQEVDLISDRAKVLFPNVESPFLIRVDSNGEIWRSVGAQPQALVTNPDGTVLIGNRPSDSEEHRLYERPLELERAQLAAIRDGTPLSRAVGLPEVSTEMLRTSTFFPALAAALQEHGRVSWGTIGQVLYRTGDETSLALLTELLSQKNGEFTRAKAVAAGLLEISGEVIEADRPILEQAERVRNSRASGHIRLFTIDGSNVNVVASGSPEYVTHIKILAEAESLWDGQRVLPPWENRPLRNGEERLPKSFVGSWMIQPGQIPAGASDSQLFPSLGNMFHGTGAGHYMLTLETTVVFSETPNIEGETITLVRRSPEVVVPLGTLQGTYLTAQTNPILQLVSELNFWHIKMEQLASSDAAAEAPSPERRQAEWLQSSLIGGLVPDFSYRDMASEGTQLLSAVPGLASGDILVGFGFNGCRPCWENKPALYKLVGEVRGNATEFPNFRFVTVTHDFAGRDGFARTVAQYQQLLTDRETQVGASLHSPGDANWYVTELPEELNVKAYPTIFWIHDGRVAGQWSPATGPLQLEQVRAALRSLDQRAQK